MILRHLSRLYSAVLLATLVGSIQSQTTVAKGMQAFGSFSGGPDIVNIGDLNVHLSLPLLHKAGRGIDFSYGLSYDSTVWLPGWSPADPTELFNWSGVGPGGTGSALYHSQQSNYNCYTYINTPSGQVEVPTGTTDTQYVYVDNMGNGHPFGNVPSTSVCGSVATGFPAYATDGSGIQLQFNGWAQGSSGTEAVLSVVLPSGQSISGGDLSAPSKIQDTNGNYLSPSGSLFWGLPTYVDTLGYQTMSTTDGGYTVNGQPDGRQDGYGGPDDPSATISYTGGDNAQHSFTIQRPVAEIATAFGCPNTREYDSGPTDSYASARLISQVQLPDGRAYSFAYEPTSTGSSKVTGRIQSVSFPQGGSVSYSYGPINCSDGSPMSLTRVVNDNNGHQATWTYQRSYLSATGQWQTVVTDPLGNQTVYLFIIGTPAVSDPGGYSQGSILTESFYEVSKTAYTGSASGGIVASRTTTCYNGNTSGGYANNCTTPVPFTYPIQSKQVSVSPEGGPLTSGSVTLYNSLGLVTEQDAFDFGTGTGQPGGLLAKTTTSYASLGGIANKPSLVQQVDGSGALLSSVTYGYDETALVATSNTPNLVAVSTPRGNLTSVTVGTGSNALKSHMTYYDTGLLASATDVNSAVTTYTYSQCGNSFLSGTAQLSGALTTAATWNCVGGVPTSSTDVNGNTMQTYYNDLYWRPTSSQDALGNTSTNTYSPNSHETSMSFNGGSSVSDSVTTTDGLGRPILSQSRQGPNWSTFASVAVKYDLRGQTQYKSLPYSAASGVVTTSGPGTTFSYDALGRTISVTDAAGGYVSYHYAGNDTSITHGPAAQGENLKVRQIETNALGQIASVCELTSASGSGSCGQTSSASGFLTQYAYDGGRLMRVAQNVQAGPASTQVRSLFYDALGRKIKEIIPETGTSTYVFDSDSSGRCSGSYPGDLVSSVDNAGNVTCYTYDALHRPLSTVVVAGSYSGITPQTHLVYDAASLGGTAMANVKGALAEAYTCTGSCSTKLTDIFHSAYPELSGGTKTGRLIQQMWESTPNSGGYMQTQQTLFPNGALGASSASLNGSPVGVPNMVFSIDRLGRPLAAADTSSGLSLVNTVGYTLAGSVSSINLGNGDSDAIGYDSQTNRPTSFGFSMIGSSPFQINGSLSWNPNSSLQNFSLTDSSDATKNQNCNYSMDDVNRLSSVSCAGSWAQTFAYDAFGNISKGQPTNPGAGQFGTSYTALYGMNGYASLNNQITGGVTSNYDSNGNQTLTTTNQLSWNASAQPVAVNGIGGVYDAAGRLVETGDAVAAVPGSVSNGSIFISASQPLPAGSQQFTASADISLAGAEQSKQVNPQNQNELAGCGYVVQASPTSGICYDAGGGGLSILVIDPSTGQTITGANYTYGYGYPSDTAGSVAQSLIASINADTPNSGFSATATATGLTLHLQAIYAASQAMVIVNGGSGCSGVVSPCSFSMQLPQQPIMATGGGPIPPASGTVTATLNGYTASYAWGGSDTSDSIASGLASDIQSKYGPQGTVTHLVSATANYGVVNLTSLSAGPSSNWGVTAQSTTTQSAYPGAVVRVSTSGMLGGTSGALGAPASGSYAVFMYSPSGEKIATLQNGVLQTATVSLPGGGTAVYNSSGFQYFRHKDWLGSSRLATKWDHTVYSKEAYAPFGETYNEVGTPDRSFTGQEANSANGYDFLFRKYDASAGRWLSPDPLGWGAVSPTYPQSLNRYAYVQNDPLRLTDPNGLACYWSNSDSDDTSKDECISNFGTYTVNDDGSGGMTGENQSIDVSPDDEDGVGYLELHYLAPIDYSAYMGSVSVTGPAAASSEEHKNPFLCGSEAAAKISAANGINHIPGAARLNSLTHGVTGFVTDAIGGNVASSLTDLIHSFATGEGGGHSVFYNMGQGVVAGPTQGFGAMFGKLIEGTPFAADLVDVGTVALVGGEYASGIGEAKLIYDGVTYFGATAGCALGIVH